MTQNPPLQFPSHSSHSQATRQHTGTILTRLQEKVIEAAIASRGRTLIWRYGTALLALAFAVAARQLYDPVLNDHLPFITLFGAVAFAVWFSGTRAAILIVLLGEICAELLFVHPSGAFLLHEPPFLMGRVAYLLTCAVIVFFGDLAVKSERNSTEQRIRLEFAQQAANAGFYEWELKQDFATWSRELRTLFGVSGHFPPTLESFARLVHPEERERVMAALHALRHTDIPEFEIMYRVVTPTGEVRHVLSRGKILADAHGQPHRILGLCIDITRQQLMEQALLKSEKLLAATRMASTVAHEVNNPLQGILGMLFIICSDSSLTPQTLQLAQTAEKEIRRLALLTQRSLSFFHDPRSAVSLNLRDLITEVLDLHRTQAETAGIKMEMSVEPACTVTFNPFELKQLLANLVLNSLDSMRSTGGTLRVSAVSGDDSVELTVEDSGTGIHDDHVDKIFDPFFTTKQTGGTGLGLWVSKNIVESHGGTLTLQTDTAPDYHGTTVTVILPKAVQKASAGN
jgi:PAS domain S-box-containing protein